MTAKSKILLIGIIFASLACCIQAATFSITKNSQKIGKECTDQGYMCENCTNSYYCLPLPNGDFIKEEMETCSGGKTCLEQTGMCTSGSNYDCNINTIGYEMNCHQPGVFPNPFSCKRFYTCVVDSEGNAFPPFHDECVSGYAFDSMTTRCTKKLVNNTCNNVIPPCESVGEIGTYGNNTSLYYMCSRRQLLDGTTIYFPELYYCQNNFHLNNENKCVDPTPSGLDSSGLCVDRKYFYYPNDCKMYTDCTAINKIPVIRRCANYYRFDAVLGKCVLFDCPRTN